MTPETHRHLGWTKAIGFDFARHLAFQALAASEIERMAQSIAVGFVKEAGRWQAVALFSSVQGQNRLVASDGCWLARSVPAALRVYPFRLDPAAPDRLALWQDSDLLPVENAEFPFYLDDLPTPTIVATHKFLKTVFDGMASLQVPLLFLEQAGALKSWTLPQPDTAPQARGLTGVYKIDACILEKLSDEAWLHLRRLNAIGWIHAHLASLHHADSLGTAPKPPATVPKIQEAQDTMTNDAKAFLTALSMDIA